jgi:predicted Zn-dependent peptidase
MVFKGTRHRNAREIARSLESVGGSLNASTGKELCVYNAIVLDEHLPLAVDVLTDLLQHPRFAEKEIALEKQVVLTEINHALEDPEEMVIDYLYQSIFHDHPLGFFIYGTPQNVKRFTRRDLVHHLKKSCAPDNMIFAAAGNVDHRQFVRLVQQHQAGIWTGQDATECAPLGSFRRINRRTQETLQQSHIAIGARTFGCTDPRKYALILLEMCLGSGMSSRLFQNIRERYGFAYSVYSFADLMGVTGVLGCYLGCEARKTDDSLELLLNEFSKLRKRSISSQELEMVKAQALGGMILGLESSGRRMHKIAENELYHGHHLSLKELVERVERVTVQDVSAVIRDYLDPANLVQMILEPS